MTADSRWLWLFGAIAAAAVWGPRSAAVPASVTRPIVVAVLFTSEGCSSCPPADMLLSQLVHQPLPDVEVLTVAEHVDYWDHLGWHDRFSSAEFSARQTIYDANAFHRHEVYTPQLVIDGRFARVGTDADGIRRDIQKAAEAEKATVTVALEPAGDRRTGVDMHVQWPDAYAFKGAIEVKRLLPPGRVVPSRGMISLKKPLTPSIDPHRRHERRDDSRRASGVVHRG